MYAIVVNTKALSDVNLIRLMEQLNESDEWSAAEWNLWNELKAEKLLRDNARRSMMKTEVQGAYTD